MKIGIIFRAGCLCVRDDGERISESLTPFCCREPYNLGNCKVLRPLE